MRLLVVRHAIAMDKTEFLQVNSDDRLRPLTAEGIRKMRKNIKGLKSLCPELNVVISSPLMRALQTSELMCDTYRLDKFEVSETLSPEADLEELFGYLKSELKTIATSDACLAVVGHEPHLSAWIAFALSGKHTTFGELRKGGACLIEFPHAIKPGAAILQWWMTAKQLRCF